MGRLRAVRCCAICAYALVKTLLCFTMGAATQVGWLGSRVVSVLDSGAKGRAWVQIAAATLSGNSLRQTVHTHRVSVHLAAKLVAALLRLRE